MEDLTLSAEFKIYCSTGPEKATKRKERMTSKSKFMGKDFLLESEAASHLYHNHAAKLPINFDFDVIRSFRLVAFSGLSNILNSAESVKSSVYWHDNAGHKF